MKLSTVFALAAFAAAGAASGQDRIGVDIPPAPRNVTADTPFVLSPGSAERIAASRAIHAACAADMRLRCAGKTGEAADRCLVYHRLSFTAACREALTGFERAAGPLAPGETLAPLHPYSLIRTVPAGPPRGWRPLPQLPAAAATGA